jgi:aspartyl/glutamyl-tRNA(Asn/Gln) amidotransferase C subunit
MARVSREELHKFAELSSLKLSEKELDDLTNDLQQLFDFVQQIDAFDTTQAEAVATHNTNLFRPDVVNHNSEIAALLRAQAPESDDTAVVVPKIVEDRTTEDA